MNQAGNVQQDVLLAPGSVMPTALLPETQTENGAPVITIDTSEAAMSEAGLTQPTDAVQSIAAAPMQAAPQVRRAVTVRRRPTTQAAPKQVAFEATPGLMEGGGAEEEGQESGMPQPSVAVKVVKLG